MKEQGFLGLTQSFGMMTISLKIIMMSKRKKNLVAVPWAAWNAWALIGQTFTRKMRGDKSPHTKELTSSRSAITPILPKTKFKERKTLWKQ